jgi:hypothetical protein
VEGRPRRVEGRTRRLFPSRSAYKVGAGEGEEGEVIGVVGVISITWNSSLVLLTYWTSAFSHRRPVEFTFAAVGESGEGGMRSEGMGRSHSLVAWCGTLVDREKGKREEEEEEGEEEDEIQSNPIQSNQMEVVNRWLLKESAAARSRTKTASLLRLCFTNQSWG